jgi:hypothetical protein
MVYLLIRKTERNIMRVTRNQTCPGFILKEGGYKVGVEQIQHSKEEEG